MANKPAIPGLPEDSCAGSILLHVENSIIMPKMLNSQNHRELSKAIGNNNYLKTLDYFFASLPAMTGKNQ